MPHTPAVYIQDGAMQVIPAAQEGLSLHPTTPNPLQKEFDASQIGPFGWIGIAFCIILVVIAAASIFNAAKSSNAKKQGEAHIDMAK